MSTRATLPGQEKATITRLDEGLEDVDETQITVSFNPGQLTVDKSVTYAEQSIVGLDAPIQQFVHGGAESLSFELFFDTYPLREDVRTRTDDVNSLLMVDGERHAPPVVRFEWGEISFTAVVESTNTTYEMFLRDGTPVRARIDLTLREYTPPRKQLAEEPRHSADRRSVRRVIEGETLPAIAAEEYGDPAAWRLIADANNIDNPRELAAGKQLLIPVQERL